MYLYRVKDVFSFPRRPVRTCDANCSDSTADAATRRDAWRTARDDAPSAPRRVHERVESSRGGADRHPSRPSSSSNSCRSARGRPFSSSYCRSSVRVTRAPESPSASAYATQFRRTGVRSRMTIRISRSSDRLFGTTSRHVRVTECQPA